MAAKATTSSTAAMAGISSMAVRAMTSSTVAVAGIGSMAVQALIFWTAVKAEISTSLEPTAMALLIQFKTAEPAA